jgi:hypothetical protein
VRIARPASQALAAAGVLALLALVAVLTSRPETPRDDSYSSTGYDAGGYRAWAALLKREGVATTRFVLRPIELDDRIDTLVSAQPVPQLSDPAVRTAADVAALAAWVRRGGRLVYAGRNAALKAAETNALALPFFLPDVGARGRLDGPDAAFVRSVAALGTDRMLLVEHAGVPVLFDGNGEIVVRYPLGRGEIVAVSAAAPFANANLAHADNARLAYLLGRPRRPGGLVAFDDGIHGALIDRPWYRALPIPLRVSLALGAVALLLGLLGSTLRTGPALPLAPPREPSSAEFVDALAALHERIGARGEARDAIVHAALAAAGSSEGDGPRRLTALLAAPAATDAELLAGAQRAYALRKDIGDDGNRDGRRAAFAGRTRTRCRW